MSLLTEKANWGLGSKRTKNHENERKVYFASVDCAGIALFMDRKAQYSYNT